MALLYRVRFSIENATLRVYIGVDSAAATGEGRAIFFEYTRSEGAVE